MPLIYNEITGEFEHSTSARSDSKSTLLEKTTKENRNNDFISIQYDSLSNGAKELYKLLRHPLGVDSFLIDRMNMDNWRVFFSLYGEDVELNKNPKCISCLDFKKDFYLHDKDNKLYYCCYRTDLRNPLLSMEFELDCWTLNDAKIFCAKIASEMNELGIPIVVYIVNDEYTKAKGSVIHNGKKYTLELEDGYKYNLSIDISFIE